MDDDYFINSPLYKSDFFYEEKNQIFPLMITNDYYLMDEKKINMEYQQYKSMINNRNSHSEDSFLFRQLSSLLFMYSIFGHDKSRNEKPLIEASFSHNAIPLKLSDIKEVYDLVLEKYKYVKETLYSIERNILSLHFQTLILSYIINKYKRKVHGISCSYIDVSNYNLYESKYNTTDKLFVVNTSDKKYEENIFMLEKIFLNKKFPSPTKYELEKGENNKVYRESKIIRIRNNRNNNKFNENDIKIKNKIPFYYLQYLWIFILVIIIFIYGTKIIRNFILGIKGYSRIKMDNSLESSI